MSRAGLMSPLAVLVVISGVGCQWLERERLYSRCEVPLEELRCPAVDLGSMLEASAWETPWAGCDLWLDEPMNTPDVDAPVLAPEAFWSIRRRGARGEDWPCSGAGVDQMVELDPALAATFGRGWLVCPSVLERCPTPPEPEPRRVCEPRGPAIRLGEGTAISTITVTGAGPAVLWAEGVVGEREARLSWLEPSGQGVSEVQTVAPCPGEPFPETPWTAEGDGLLPTQQAVALGEGLLIAGLCGEPGLVEIRPTGEVESHPVGRDDGRGTPRQALSVTSAAEDEALALWTDGERLMSTLYDISGEALVRQGEDRELYSPTRFTRERPSVVCTGDQDDPFCLVGWVDAPPEVEEWSLERARVLEGRTGVVSWQTTGARAGFEAAGTLGRGRDLQLVTTHGAGAVERMGVAVWRDHDHGIMAADWSVSADVGVSVDDEVVQLGPGRERPDGGWTLSAPTVIAIDERRCIAGWWHQSADGSFELDLRLIWVRPDEPGLGVAPLAVRWFDAIQPQVEDEISAPALAWRPATGAEPWSASLMVAWWERHEETDRFVVSLLSPLTPLPDEPEPHQLEILSSESFEIEDWCYSYMGYEPHCALAAAEVDGEFVLGIASGEGLVLNRITEDALDGGDELYIDHFVSSTDAIDLALRPASSGAPGELWAVYESWCDPADEETLDVCAIEEVGFGASLLEVDEGGIWEIATSPWPLIRHDDQRVHIQASLSTASAPVVAWTEVTLPMYLLDDVPDVEQYSSAWDTWHDLERKRTRLGRLTADRGAGTVGLVELELTPVDVSPRQPRAALGTVTSCPNTPFLDEGARCVLASFTTLVGEDFDSYGEDFDWYERTPNGLVMAAIDGRERPFWIQPGENYLPDHRLLPTGLVSGLERALSVFMEMSPEGDDEGSFWEERLLLERANFDQQWAVSDWLSELGDMMSAEWRPLSLHLAPGAGEPRERVAMVWSRSAYQVSRCVCGSEVSFCNCCRDIQFPDPDRQSAMDEELYGRRSIEVLFAEADLDMRPSSRALSLDAWGAPAPFMWTQYVELPEYIAVREETDMVTPHYGSAVAEVGEGEYLVGWVRTEVDWMNDPRADEELYGEEQCVPEQVRGEVWVRQVICL